MGDQTAANNVKTKQNRKKATTTTKKTKKTFQCNLSCAPVLMKITILAQTCIGWPNDEKTN